MKILHIVPGHDDPTCGIAVAAKMIAASQRKKGHTVRTGIRLAVSDFEWADEVWVHSMWTPTVFRGCLGAIRAKKPLVRMTHGCADPLKMAYHWWKKRWVAPLERWFFRRTDRVVVTCADEFHQVYAFALGVKRIEQMDLGRLAVNSIAQSECLRPMDFRPIRRKRDGMRLLFIGRLHPLKGLDILIDVLTKVNRPDVSLTVIGRDEKGLRVVYEKQAKGFPVQFLGVVEEPVKQSVMDESDVLVLPTLSENFGLVVAEALERGKRVITTDGAPVWDPGMYENGVGVGYGGQLLYLKGFRDGTWEERVRLLKEAITMMGDEQNLNES